jgi:hypothetical protein
VLNGKNILNIPRCLDFCDFEDRYHQTQTHTFIKRLCMPQTYKHSIPSRRLHCLILDTEGRKLEDFYMQQGEDTCYPRCDNRYRSSRL